MKGFFVRHPLIGFFIVAVLAAVVSAWLLNPKSGLWSLLSGGMTWATAITLIVVLLIFIGGAALTYVALRLAGDPTPVETTDQRGLPRSAGQATDIGAVEVQLAMPS